MNLENARLPFSFPRIQINPVFVLGLIIILALISFELFNFTTTEFALKDLLGEFAFLGLSWATILSVAFCAVDFAGVARLFVTGKDNKEPKEVWYLFGAWLLAASMNATLTWWGISVAVLSHPIKSSNVVDPTTLIRAVPVFVAIMIWVIRVLIIGTISTAGTSLLKGERQNGNHSRRFNSAPLMGTSSMNRPTGTVGAMRSARPGNANMGSRHSINRPMTDGGVGEGGSSRSEPTYHRSL